MEHNNGRMTEGYKLQEAEVTLKVSERPTIKVTNPDDIYIAYKDLENELKEKFFVIHLNTKKEVICFELVHIGGMSSALVDPRCIFRTALLVGAVSIILLHNHPSGDVTPSNEDKAITELLKNAGKLLQIAVVDHVIVGKDKYFSFVNAGI